MAFKHLEEAVVDLPNQELAQYMQIFEGLREPTKTVLGYTLDIAAYLKKVKLNDDYAVFGGYAVLSHLMNILGPQVALLWRGSKDIDMAGTMRVLGALKAVYSVTNDSVSPNVADKRTVKLVEDHEKACKIDFYYGNCQDRFAEPEINYHFGIPLRVITPLKIIRGKLNTPREELVHSTDILRMLAVLERRDVSPEYISHQFTADQKDNLLARVQAGHESSGDRLDFVPSQTYERKLGKYLKQGKPIV